MRKTAFLVMFFVIIIVFVSCATSQSGSSSELVPHEYTDVALLPNFTVNYNGKEETITAVEGCVVLDGYGYVAKIKNDRAGYLFRIDLSTGEKITLTDADTGLESNLAFYHANDLAIFEMDGKHFLLVGTLSSDDNKLLALVELIDAGDGKGITQ